MPKVLILDTDRSLASLASDDRIEQVFGYRPRRFLNSNSLLNLIDKMFERCVETYEDELGTAEQEYFRLREGKELHYVVLDSLTAFQQIKRKELKDESTTGRLRIQDYGELADSMEDVLYGLLGSNVPFIATCHTKAVDDGYGGTKFVPSLQGRMRDELFKHFDIVAYTIVRTDDDGNRQYLWQIVADEARDAKCRFEEVTKWAMKQPTKGLIHQDFALLTAKIKDSGFNKFNMVIIGPSGTGKTYSLRTLKNAVIFNNGEQE